MPPDRPHSPVTFLYGLVASPHPSPDHRPYNVFSLRIDSPNVPLAELRIHVATRLGLDPNSPHAGAIHVYRLDEDVSDNDKRLLHADTDPTSLFQLTRMQDSLQTVGSWIPRATDRATHGFHLLVSLPAASAAAASEADLGWLNTLPPAYSENAFADPPAMPTAWSSRTMIPDEDQKSRPVSPNPSDSFHSHINVAMPVPLSIPSDPSTDPSTRRKPTQSLTYQDYTRAGFNLSLNHMSQGKDYAPVSAPAKTQANPGKPSQRKKIILGVILLVVALIGGIVAAVVVIKTKSNSSSSSNSNTADTPSSSPTPASTSTGSAGSQPTPAPSVPAAWLSLQGRDFLGNDLPSFGPGITNVPTVEACGTLCENDPLCAGAVYLNNTCYGKSDMVPNPAARATVHLVFRNQTLAFNRDFTLITNTDHNGDDLACFNGVANPEPCHSLCYAVRTCRAVNYWALNKQCCIKNVPGPLVLTQGINFWSRK
ncbi:hypothetical protein DFJ77DRAFT_460209 [Powellomyces hirtus]|nr:hypothetical protein DFJ77DRAFT_460209 [Powellomyces hirtus]